MKHAIKIKWTCTNFVHHVHRWRFTAWLCGRKQLLARRFHCFMVASHDFHWIDDWTQSRCTRCGKVRENFR